MSSSPVRCVLVGDEDVGKTSLLITYLTNRFPEIYVPTILDSSAVNVKIKNKTYTLGLFDTSTALTQDYLKTDVFLLCFSFDKPLSLQNIEEIWLPMLQMNNPKAKIVLVGLKSDLKNFMNNLIMSKHAEDIAEKLNEEAPVVPQRTPPRSLENSPLSSPRNIPSLMGGKKFDTTASPETPSKERSAFCNDFKNVNFVKIGPDMCPKILNLISLRQLAKVSRNNNIFLQKLDSTIQK